MCLCVNVCVRALTCILSVCVCMTMYLFYVCLLVSQGLFLLLLALGGAVCDVVEAGSDARQVEQ